MGRLALSRYVALTIHPDFEASVQLFRRKPFFRLKNRRVLRRGSSQNRVLAVISKSDDVSVFNGESSGSVSSSGNRTSSDVTIADAIHNSPEGLVVVIIVINITMRA